ncbi:hypothetical protein GCM10010329_22780 [Streptomyces spiroverticillatus]|uniref:Uncharacterized protein n=1 Tax=Streptomyces finlayi TaxID=67296 RepID=A0A919C963_9ACTN|nr:hypothetical protein GCM10010329_22780 [Streptomyces spiroverticillatus]GHC84872.1 hypothetical protein GCM10010334_15200 [Streptomyces finlayi]
MRWLLDPATSLLALHLRGQENKPMSYDAAWRLARVTRHPGELVYRMHGHSPEDHPPKQG